MFTDIQQAQFHRSTTWIAPELLGEHKELLSIILHLFPGVMTAVVFFAFRPLVVSAGIPPHVALVLAIPFAMIPAQLGLLLFLGYIQNGRLSLRGVVLYNEKIQFRKYFVYVPLVFMTSLAVIAIVSSVLDSALRTAAFAWMPSVDWDLGSGYSRSVLVVSISLTALFVTLGESAVEEFYFRGFLLPRMRYAGRWAVALHCFLFALYHVWQPWRIVSIAIGMLPVVFTARRTRNIYVGMIAHMLINAYEVIVGVVFILAMTSR